MARACGIQMKPLRNKNTQTERLRQKIARNRENKQKKKIMRETKTKQTKPFMKDI